MTLCGRALMTSEALRRTRDNAIAGQYVPAKSKCRLRRMYLRPDVTWIELDDRNHRRNVVSADDGTILRTRTAHSIEVVTDESRP